MIINSQWWQSTRKYYLGGKWICCKRCIIFQQLGGNIIQVSKSGNMIDPNFVCIGITGVGFSFFYSSNMMSNVFNRESTMKTERERIRGCWRLIKRWFVRFILWFQSFLNLLSLDSTNNLLLMLLLLLWWFIRVRKYFCVSVYVRVCTKNNYYFLTRPPPPKPHISKIYYSV